MKVRIVLELEIGTTPTADAITYFIDRYGRADGDDVYSPEEWAEQVILDVLEAARTELPSPWRVEASDVERMLGKHDGEDNIVARKVRRA